MTTRQEDCAYSCQLLKPTNTKEQLLQKYLPKLSVTNKNCSYHSVNTSFEFISQDSNKVDFDSVNEAEMGAKGRGQFQTRETRAPLPRLEPPLL